MSLSTRAATLADVDPLAALLLRAAKHRHAQDASLWSLPADAKERIAQSIRSYLEAENPPFRQQWLLGLEGGEIIGAVHSILLPVPPIYAGDFGPPGLIMDDCYVHPEAPAGSAAQLFEAAQEDLIAAGAQVLLAACARAGGHLDVIQEAGYAPLTLYFAKTALSPQGGAGQEIRDAAPTDIAGIVAASAENRKVLYGLNSFWKPHAQADARFGGWMTRSLTLPDRDMRVSSEHGQISGYCVSQPATALHFPSAHSVQGIGFIDDYYHSNFADPQVLAQGGAGALALLRAGESALVARGNHAALLVCPAAWASKIEMLGKAGFETALTWFIKE